MQMIPEGIHNIPEVYEQMRKLCTPIISV